MRAKLSTWCPERSIPLRKKPHIFVSLQNTLILEMYDNSRFNYFYSTSPIHWSFPALPRDKSLVLTSVFPGDIFSCFDWMSWNSLQLSVLKPKPKVIATANHNKDLCHHWPMRTESNSGWLRKERENAGGQVTSGVHLASDWFRHSSRPDQTQTDIKLNQCNPGIFATLRWKLLHILRFCFKTTDWNRSHTYAKNVLRLKIYASQDLNRQQHPRGQRFVPSTKPQKRYLQKYSTLNKWGTYHLLSFFSLFICFQTSSIL